MAKQTAACDKWVKLDKYPKGFLEDSAYSDIEKQLLFSRGVLNENQAEDFLNPKYENLADPFLLGGMSEAVEIVSEAREKGERVAIYGDYDVDGICATSILYEALSDFGIKTEYYIPSREDEGYGLNKEALKSLSESGVGLVITVDCGVTAIEEVAYTKELGLKIIVTDHHTILEVKHNQILPDAVVINPKRKDQKYPFSELSGSGVAFMLAYALQKKFPNNFKMSEKWLLDLAAIGTICDVVPLTGENRILSSFGLVVLKKTKRVGLQMLARASGIDIDIISSVNVGFQIGPRLNAAGRLQTAEKAIKLLLSKNENEARILALELNKLNVERQDITMRIVDEAIAQIEAKDENAKIFLLSHDSWPKGVVGIVASRLTDRYSRPVIVFEDKEGRLTGSARSPQNFNIIDALSSCSEFLIKFGGHARAAGLTLEKEHFVLLENKLLEIGDNSIKDEDMCRTMMYESEVSTEIFDSRIHNFLQRLEPFGFANPIPFFFLPSVDVEEIRMVGKTQKHAKIKFVRDGQRVSGIYFNYKNEGAEAGKKDLLFNLQKNEWNGSISYEAKVGAMRDTELGIINKEL